MTTVKIATHPLTAADAHAIVAVLNAVAHIHVSIHVNQVGTVEVRPVGRALSVAEEVTSLRAVAAVSDSPMRYLAAVV